MTGSAEPGSASAEVALGQPSLDEVFLALTGHAGQPEPPATTEDEAA